MSYGGYSGAGAGSGLNIGGYTGAPIIGGSETDISSLGNIGVIPILPADTLPGALSPNDNILSGLSSSIPLINEGTSITSGIGTSTDTSAASGGTNWANVLGAIAGVATVGAKTYGAISSVNAAGQAASLQAQNVAALQAQELAAQQAALSNPLGALTASPIFPLLLIGGIFLLMNGKKK
jgi:hypothetical protein